MTWWPLQTVSPKESLYLPQPSTNLIPPRCITVTAEEIQRLYKRFVKLDKDGSGSISKEEFLSLAPIATNPLAQRLLAVFDGDGSGDIDFKEFISGLSAFSAKGNKDEKLKCEFCGAESWSPVGYHASCGITLTPSILKTISRV